MIRKTLSAIYDFITSPFNRNLAYFVGWLLLVIPASLYMMLRAWYFNFGFYIFVQDFATTYLLTLPLAIFRLRWLRNTYITIVTTYYVIFCMFDVFCLAGFKFPFSVAEAALVAETNKEEATSMLSMYLDWKFILSLLCVLGISYCAFRLLRRVKLYSHILNVAALVFIGIFMIKGLKHPDSMAQGPITKLAVILWRVERLPSAEDMDTNPQITVVEEGPQKFVLIFGESHSSKNTSLYGYSRSTSPNMSALADSGRLFVFTDVHSADTRTTGSFKKMMSTYNDDSTDKWYKYHNIPIVIGKTGTRTQWISNQNETGLSDGAIACYVHLCDTFMFAEHKVNNHDEVLLPLIQQMHSGAKSFDVIHLMGSHEAFNDRYPKEYAYFTPEMYTDLPESQRSEMAHYDNSLLYNDWIVSQIIDTYNDDEAIVLYCSDHGMDLYDSSDDYVGHARHLSEVSYEAACRVPMWIYVTEKYREAHPEKVARISQSTANSVDLADLIYTVMDLYGIKFSDNDDVAKKSKINH